MRDAVAVALHHRFQRCAARAEIVDPLEPYHRAHVRQADDVAVQPAQRGRPAVDRVHGAVAFGTHHLIAADALVHHGITIAECRVHPPGKHVRPAVVAIDRRSRAVGDRIAKGHDRPRRRRHRHRNRIEKEPGCRGIREFRLPIVLGMGRAGPREVRRLQSFCVPCHRPAAARDMEADGQLTPHQQRIGGILHEGQGDRVAPHRSTGRNGHPAFSVERHHAVAVGQHRRARGL